jgi:hypothetical protein
MHTEFFLEKKLGKMDFSEQTAKKNEVTRGWRKSHNEELERFIRMII